MLEIHVFPIGLIDQFIVVLSHTQCLIHTMNGNRKKNRKVSKFGINTKSRMKRKIAYHEMMCQKWYCYYQIPQNTKHQIQWLYNSQIAKRNSIWSNPMFNVQCSLILCSTQFIFRLQMQINELLINSDSQFFPILIPFYYSLTLIGMPVVWTIDFVCLNRLKQMQEQQKWWNSFGWMFNV